MAEERESGGHDDDVGGDRICSDAYGGDDVVDDDNDEDDEDEDEEDTNYVGRSSASSPDITMFAVKVVTCGALRAELKMTGREKRGRMFVERPSDFDVNYDNNRRGDDRDDDSSSSYACNSVAALRRTIHEFFRRLKKSTYVLSASLPTFDVDGNMLTHPETDDDDDNDYNVKGGADDVVDCDNTVGGGTWSLESDDDVRLAFVRAEEFYREHRSSATTMMKRPTLVLHVTKDPNASPPRSPPSYLRDMPDPLTSGTMTMLSFYSFPPGGIPDPEKCAELLRRRWRPFRALGRVYVATEGVNAQMAVPTNVLSAFLRCCSIPSPSSSDDAVVDDDGDGELSNVLGRHVENGINVDPVPVDSAVFASDPPFRNLHVRVRAQIVADGLDAPLNWQGAGYDMPPLEWHRRLKEARDAARNDDDDGGASTPPPPLPIVLDCRNGYETQVGRFELAEPLGTENFRESWDVLRERLRDVPKDAPIMTYCTGGIRCVKVNAYLTQEMEFTNVSRLAGGVVAYDRILGEQLPDEEPMFKGVNFVFDGRMGRKITDDKLGTCHTCGEATNFITNCRNDNCHKRIVQCERCGDSFLGTCSEACKTRVVNAGMAPMRNHRIGPSGERGSSASAEDGGRVEGTGDGANYSSLDDYSSAHSTVQPPLLREIESNTRRLLPTGAHMVSGSMQGSLLTTLASVSREGRILEIGTFTGYATACFLLGAAQAGASLGASTVGTRYGGGPFVLSLERDRSALGLASAHLRAMTEYGIGEEGATRLRDIGPDGTCDICD
jgi:predicted sulfurtransferase